MASDMHRLACLSLALLLTACSTKVVRVDADPARLAAPPAASKAAVRLACPYRLADVVDARPGGESGGLGVHAFRFGDVAGIVRSQLQDAGLHAAENPSSVGAPAVDLRVLQLYLSQNLGTKIPVAVYEVAIDDGPAFVLRSQKATMNWNGSQDEAYAAYARVLADVNQQLLRQLNARCAR